MGASHVAAWSLTPVANLDVNQQVLQNQELAFVTTFARTGDPTGDGTPIWHPFRLDRDRDRRHDDDEGSPLGLVMSLNAGADSQATLHAQIAMVHHCGFWDEVTPKPGRHGR
jgi:para-nitrobenzyl esterase